MTRPLLRHMLRPKWIGVLALVLIVAAVFALLAQWQIGRAVENATVEVRDTETVVPLGALQQPQVPTTDDVAEHRVRVSGTWLAADTLVVADRVQGQTVEGYWVVGRLVVGDGALASNLAVALGWEPSREGAEAAAAEIAAGEVVPASSFVGRFYPGEAPELLVDGLSPALAPAALINLWQADGPAISFSGYLIAEEAPAGLDPVQVREPELEVHFNWLNIVYAIEWILFGLFAFYLWYRLVRDEFELEQERAAESAQADAPAQSSGSDSSTETAAAEAATR